MMASKAGKGRGKSKGVARQPAGKGGTGDVARVANTLQSLMKGGKGGKAGYPATGQGFGGKGERRNEGGKEGQRARERESNGEI